MMRERQYGGKGSEIWDGRVHIQWHTLRVRVRTKNPTGFNISMEIVVIAWQGSGIKGCIRWYPVID